MEFSIKNASTEREGENHSSHNASVNQAVWEMLGPLTTQFGRKLGQNTQHYVGLKFPSLSYESLPIALPFAFSLIPSTAFALVFSEHASK